MRSEQGQFHWVNYQHRAKFIEIHFAHRKFDASLICWRCLIWIICSVRRKWIVHGFESSLMSKDLLSHYFVEKKAQMFSFVKPRSVKILAMWKIRLFPRGEIWFWTRNKFFPEKSLTLQEELFSRHFNVQKIVIFQRRIKFLLADQKQPVTFVS